MDGILGHKDIYLHFLSLLSITESAISLRRLLKLTLLSSLRVRYGNKPDSISSVGSKSMRSKIGASPEIITV